MQPGDWQFLDASRAGCLQDVVEYTHILRNVRWRDIKNSDVLRERVVRGEGERDIDGVEAEIKRCYDIPTHADIGDRLMYIFEYQHHQVALG